MKFSSTGRPKESIFAQLEAFRKHDIQTHGGRTWAYVYDHGQSEIDSVAKAAYGMFLSENGLDPTVFPSLVHLENELVAMAVSHLNGGPGVVGNFTSGGTESILLAVKAARDYSREDKPEIKAPEMVLPATAHPAFYKAAHYLNVVPVPVPVDLNTFKADASKMQSAITANTILLVGSAVSYAHGVLDPISEIGQLALKNKLLFHVDGCIGGWLLPYYKRLGATVPDFDFAVPGVTSISMDYHKYAYCPKGASVILYQDKAVRKHQMFAWSRWPGYTLINTCVQSSKSGGPLAAAWAVLNFIGDHGYLKIARQTRAATEKVISGIEAMADFRILGRPELCLVAFTSDTVNVFQIIDEMKEMGWYLQPQLSFDGSRENIHLSVTAKSLETVDDMLADLQIALGKVKSVKDEATGRGELLETVANLKPDRVNAEVFSQMLALAGIEGGKLPDRMAQINEILNALPPELTEQLLLTYFNELFQPHQYTAK